MLAGAPAFGHSSSNKQVLRLSHVLPCSFALLQKSRIGGGAIEIHDAALAGEKAKERWQIELFFCSLKQSLRVKTFVGTSANALKTQLWTALIAMLLVKYLQLKASFGWSLSNLVALLRQQLFVYRDLWTWLDDPFQPPPIPAALPEQLTLQLV